MKFSYNWLKELVPFKDTPAGLAEFLTMRVFEVEAVERAGSDWTLDIKVLPNRIADASGHIGMAREIASLKNVRIKNQELRIKEDNKKKAKDFLQVKIEDAKDCTRYTARMMAGIKVGQSPAWLRERLATCGLQSINNIVDAANYVMLETGQPLHVFDYEKLEGGMSKTESGKGDTLHSTFYTRKIITVRRARSGERMEGLDDKIYALTPDMLVIADGERPVAIAGIKGGRDSGVSDATHTIVIEAANFAPVLIRKTSQALALRTDASIRFEHGLDPNETATAAERLALLIQKIAGGTVLTGAIDAYPKKTSAQKILFHPADAERLIGAAIPAAFYASAFKRLGWQATKKGKDFVVLPPAIRRDIAIEEDITEEIARLFGYENVRPAMPRAPLISPEINTELFWEDRVRDMASGMGFTESILSQFTGDRELNAYKIDRGGLLELHNPTSPETQYLTPRLLTKYVSSAAENLRHESDVRLFGIGKSFRKSEGGIVPGVVERTDAVFVLAKLGVSGEDEFYELKGTVEQIFGSLGISEHWYDDVLESGIRNQELGIFHPYRMAEIKVGDEKIGLIGEIHPAIIEHIKSRARITVAEIDMQKLAALAHAEAEFRPIGKYPAIIRDIAVVVPQDARTDDILNIIENTGGMLLADTDLFDYFQDDGLRESQQKSLAFHLVFQSPERTLTDAEADAVIKKIIAALEAQNWEVKK